MFEGTTEGIRTTSNDIIWMSDLKVFNADFDVFVCWGLLLLPFRGQNYFILKKNRYLQAPRQY